VNPEIRSADDLRGIDSDWLARDADDYVGLLSTAGGGYTPEGFVQNLDAHVAATFLADPTVWLQPPETPVTAAELPAIVVSVLSYMQYRRLQFATLTTISADLLQR
jgi:hypothetical protein